MIRAAVCGLGRWGCRLVESVQGRSGDIAFSTAVVRSRAKQEADAARLGLALTENYDVVLSDPAIDAVVLATPPMLHAGQAVAAAKAGKHVFVEKPFTVTKAEAETVVRACADAGVVLAVGFNRRFLPAYADMRDLIGEGRIGEILHIEANFSGPTGFRLSAESWRAARAANPAGGMVARGIHCLDMMIALCGEVASVYAESARRAVALEMDDTTSVLLRFRGGATASLATIMATGELWRFQVFGTAGWIEMHGQDSLAVSDLGQVTERRGYDPVDLERAELEAFAAAVSGRAAFPVPAEDAVRGSAAFAAIAESAGTGQPVRLV